MLLDLVSPRGHPHYIQPYIAQVAAAMKKEALQSKPAAKALGCGRTSLGQLTGP